jgi:hypothetical protein
LAKPIAAGVGLPLSSKAAASAGPRLLFSISACFASRSETIRAILRGVANHLIPCWASLAFNRPSSIPLAKADAN